MTAVLLPMGNGIYGRFMGQRVKIMKSENNESCTQPNEAVE